ncbi:hypothetical protein V9T40_010026 [Parthenolecanium corni]|uniref:ABC transporter domain-containing protein n=1 Tax=Parthenolecanium corni TaxID=536013 RepID=A0AAN9Y799_9HEMI
MSEKTSVVRYDKDGGKVDMKLQNEDAASCVRLRNEADPVGIHFENISCSVRAGLSFWRNERKLILKSVSGDFEAGKFTAIIGPSGSGKSTLMDIISGYRLKDVTGNVYVNGSQSNIKQLTKKSGYIMQDDKLQQLLTIEEAMMFAANVKLRANLRISAKRAMVMEILKNFSLVDHIHTLTKNLSGGQRKRLAIALELISNPPVLFLDEPTSGLDSKAAKQCLEILRQLSFEGRTVVCSIHQPSTLMLNLFHNAYMLADGRCVYQGSVNNFLPFLTANELECPVYHNPVEFLIEICVFAPETHINGLVNSINNGKSQEWLDNPTCWTSIPLEKSRENVSRKNSKVQRIQYATPFFLQLFHLLKRIFLISSRDRFLTYLALGANIATGLALGGFFYNIGNNAKKVFVNLNVVFLWVMFVMYNALTSRVVTFPNELPVIKREHFNRWYSLKAYFIASTIGDIPVQVICVSLFMSIVYYLTGQPVEIKRFSYSTLTLILIAIIFQDYGICVGTLLDVQTGFIFGVFSTFPWVMFSGFFLYARDTPQIFRKLFDLSIVRRGFEAIVISLIGFDRKPFACYDVFCAFRFPEFVSRIIDIDLDNFEKDIMFLVITLLITKLCCFFALMYKISWKR